MISTHVLDTSTGTPAAGITVSLEVHEQNAWRELYAARTDADGRVRELYPTRVSDTLPAGAGLAAGRYRLVFDTAAYFAATDRTTFYPAITVEIEVRAVAQHHHVPLLLSPFGYSTYRGS
jgi:5-hydroxyisourate hydrolase